MGLLLSRLGAAKLKAGSPYFLSFMFGTHSSLIYDYSAEYAILFRLLSMSTRSPHCSNDGYSRCISVVSFHVSNCITKKTSKLGKCLAVPLCL